MFFIKTKIRKPILLKYWNIEEKEHFNLSHDKASELEKNSEFLSEKIRTNLNIKDKVLFSRLVEGCGGEENRQAIICRYAKLLRGEVELWRKTGRSFTLVNHKSSD